ncbi:hypothetical protein N7501_011280 [Penicillium viridicatum]|nr:hypothetical protein N7501_011280 [Penicillium viridicatum]
MFFVTPYNNPVQLGGPSHAFDACEAYQILVNESKTCIMQRQHESKAGIGSLGMHPLKCNLTESSTSD